MSFLLFHLFQKTKIATKMNEAMKGLTQQQQKQQLPLPAPQPQLSQLPLMDSAAFSATSPGEMYSGELLRNAPPISGMFPKNGNSSGGDRQPLGGYSTPLDPYQTALRFIQNQCYEEALEVVSQSDFISTISVIRWKGMPLCLYILIFLQGCSIG